MAHVTFIHGIGNKPPADALLSAWLTSLSDNDGLELPADGVSSSMAYWADFMYAAPLPPSRAAESLEAVEQQGIEDVDMDWLAKADGQEQALVAGLAAKIETARVGAVEPSAPAPPGDEELLPPFMAERFLRTFLRDVHHYLFNERYSPRPGSEHPIRDAIRERVVETLRQGADRPGPHVVVGHSMGTVIVFDCLKRVGASPRVDALVTIGSPLGLSEIQDQLKPEWTRSDGFPGERLAGRWLNVYDRRDVVAAADPKLANDYRRRGAEVVVDLREDNYGAWRHDIGKYLGGERLRSELAGLLGVGWP
jgi:predicted alpha/beta hydrolase family esterase